MSDQPDLASQFPQLQNPQAAIFRISEAFVAQEYALAGLELFRRFAHYPSPAAEFGETMVITSPRDYNNVVLTVGRWWILNFHIAEAESLDDADADDDDIDEVGGQTAGELDAGDAEGAELVEGEEHAAGGVKVGGGVQAESGDEEPEGEADEDAGDDPMELIEATFYQVGPFLLDATIIPAETIFERQDLDCYAYDFPEERIAGDRFYWAHLVWEPEDLSNPDLIRALESACEYVLATYPEEAPYSESHDHDLAQLIADPALAGRAVAEVDFGDVVILNGTDEDE